jgi:hypothetical protein
MLVHIDLCDQECVGIVGVVVFHRTRTERFICSHSTIRPSTLGCLKCMGLFCVW